MYLLLISVFPLKVKCGTDMIYLWYIGLIYSWSSSIDQWVSNNKVYSYVIDNVLSM
jgi:hypothetical protein